MKKLQHHGFRGHCHNYLKSYFNNRMQCVYINGFKSDTMAVTNGVPQGSILGPLCFNLFINDLPSAVDAHTVLFADDAAFVITAQSLQELYDKIIKLFSDLARYLNMNRLVPNSSKSKLMMFSSPPTQDLPELVFTGEVIEWVDEFKYLGLIITNKLCFANHISRVALNISRITGIFTNVRSIVPYHIVMKLYFALAFPHLMNHVVIWGSAPPSCHLKILATHQNDMLRVMSGVRWVDGRPDISTRKMYKSNGAMNINSIFKYCLFKLIRQLLDGRLPEFFRILLEPHISHHTYGTRGGRFRHPALVSEVERRFLPHQLISLYDSLTGELLTQNLTTSLRNFR